MKRKMTTVLWPVLCVALFAIALPATAGAQTATQQGYDESGVLGSVQDQGTGGAAGSADVAAQSTTGGDATLPFTGADLMIVLGLGVVLGLTGLVLRRAAQSRITS